MNKQMDRVKLAITINPLATPFRTSMEFIVFPVIGIIKTINPRYSNGIWTSSNNGNARSESYAPRKIIGSAAIAKVAGLNQPPITFLSST